MTLTISNSTEDGLIASTVELPDAGTTARVSGTIRHSQLEAGVVFTGVTVNIPATPAEGVTVNYIIQVNETTGTPSVKESTTEMPAPDAGNIVVLKQTLAHTSVDPASAGVVSPDAG